MNTYSHNYTVIRGRWWALAIQMKYLKKHQTYELFASHRMTLQLVILIDFACAKLSSGTAAAAADNWRGVDSRAWLRNREKALFALKSTAEIHCQFGLAECK